VKSSKVVTKLAVVVNILTITLCGSGFGGILAITLLSTLSQYQHFAQQILL